MKIAVTLMTADMRNGDPEHLDAAQIMGSIEMSFCEQIVFSYSIRKRIIHNTTCERQNRVERNPETDSTPLVQNILDSPETADVPVSENTPSSDEESSISDITTKMPQDDENDTTSPEDMPDFDESYVKRRLNYAYQLKDFVSERKKPTLPNGVSCIIPPSQHKSKESPFYNHDIITSINSYPISTVNELGEELYNYKAGETVRLRVIRSSIIALQ